MIESDILKKSGISHTESKLRWIKSSQETILFQVIISAGQHSSANLSCFISPSCGRSSQNPNAAHKNAIHQMEGENTLS